MDGGMTGVDRILLVRVATAVVLLPLVLWLLWLGGLPFALLVSAAAAVAAWELNELPGQGAQAGQGATPRDRLRGAEIASIPACCSARWCGCASSPTGSPGWSSRWR